MRTPGPDRPRCRAAGFTSCWRVDLCPAARGAQPEVNPLGAAHGFRATSPVASYDRSALDRAGRLGEVAAGLLLVLLSAGALFFPWLDTGIGQMSVWQAHDLCSGIG